MPVRSDVTYVYDGSLEGLLCCVFESFEKKEQPCVICQEGAGQLALYAEKSVITDIQKANRVKRGVIQKASYDAYELIEYGFLTCHPKKELLILRFIRLAMETGKRALSMLTDDTVSELFNAVRALSREAEKYKGFVRFQDADGVLVAQIEPQNYVLPLLAPHFCDRFPSESFLIFDKTHKDALLYQTGQTVLVRTEKLAFPKPDEQESKFRGLWKLFYDTIAIEARENPRCRMNFMPKRYWPLLTEMQEQGMPHSMVGLALQFPSLAEPEHKREG